jgi:mRNA-degrading endonuclease RelE of RelBE toxin-antitoxin system
MSYNIFPTRRFEKELKRLAKKFPSLKNEFAELIAKITANPEAGTSIGNNCYKIRMAIGSKGKGKSGGARVITYRDSVNFLDHFQTPSPTLLSFHPRQLRDAMGQFNKTP